MAFSAPSVPSFPLDVPTKTLSRVSFASLSEGDAQEAAALYRACTTDGFFLLNLTDSDQGRAFLGVVDRMFGLQESFFQLPLDVKRQYIGERFLGYKPQGAAKGDLDGRPDRCEMWTTLKEDILGARSPLPAPHLMTSHRDLHEQFVRGAHAVEDVVLASLEASLKMPPDTLTVMHHIDSETMDQYRMICYPPQPPPENVTSSMVPHRDFGSMTTLFNILGGLQFLPPEADPRVETDWLYIQPVAGHAIINIGDVMVKFTNGRLKSPMHRVVAPPGAQARLTRYALAYFARPEVRTIVRRLDGGEIPALGPGETEEELEARDWLVAKIKSVTT